MAPPLAAFEKRLMSVKVCRQCEGGLIVPAARSNSPTIIPRARSRSSAALELPRASGAAHECVRIEEFHPVSSAPELDEHHASRVELEQVHPVGGIERIEPHGTTPTASAFFESSSLYKSESTEDRDPALHALWV